MKKYIFIFILLFFPVIAFNQNNSTNQERLKQYWYLRWRLINYFMVVGDCPGCSLPASVRNFWCDPQVINNVQYWSSCMNFGDAANYLSTYIGILATEYKILDNNGQNTDSTLRELFFALRAINRLDEFEAQYPFNMPANRLDGLCSRGDVPFNFIINPWDISEQNHFNELNRFLDNFVPVPGDPTGVNLASSYDYGAAHDNIPAGDTNGCCFSQDHISSILVGLALVKKFVPDGITINGMNLHDEAKQITKRIIDYMQRSSWYLKNPHDVPLPEGLGSYAMFYSYGFAAAASNIWPQHAPDFMGPFPLSFKPLWDALATAYLGATDICSYIVNAGNIMGFPLTSVCENANNAWIILNLAAVGNSWETVTLDAAFLGANPSLAIACWLPGVECTQGLISGHSSIYGWQAYYPLLHAVLHNTVCLTSRSDIENDLNSMPCTGNFFGGAGGPASVGWATPIKYHNLPYVNINGDPGFPGNYSGLEFMLIHNLYYLYDNEDSQGNDLPLYESYMDGAGAEDIPVDIPFFTNNLGSQNWPVEVDKFRSITYSGTIHAVAGDPNETGDVTLRAGEEISLEGEFEVEEGAEFFAYIDPFECSGTSYARQGDTSQNGTGRSISDSSQKNVDLLYGMHTPPFEKNNFVPLEYNTDQPAVNREVLPDTAKSKPINSKTGESQQQPEYYVALTPNPTPGKFTITIKGTGTTHLTITDILGRTVFQSAISNPQSAIDLSSSPPGIYFVKVITGDNVFVEKIVVQ